MDPQFIVEGGARKAELGMALFEGDFGA